MNYKILRCTIQSLHDKYNSGKLVQGNYVFVIDAHPQPICISTSTDNFESIVQIAARVLDIFERLSLSTLFLIKPEAAPEKGVRLDEVVTSIVFTEECLRIVMEAYRPSNLRLLCFHVANYGISSTYKNGRMLARTFDDLSHPGDAYNGSDRLTVVIPHQGNLSYLDSCLKGINDSAIPPSQIWVYFDEELRQDHFEIVEKHLFPKYRKMNPPNCGPYVPRNHCVKHANTDYVCFQDSDDIPTYDRFTEIYQFINQNPMVDMAGCHELRVDELEEKVLAVRFPVNVTRALEVTASHPLFHPTAFAKIESVKKAGLFSTIRRYGADSQFLLRAHFSMEIRNLDKFLYIRRKRPGSLTTSPNTMLGSPDRTRLDISWKTDFELVKSGAICLENSTLQVEPLDSLVYIEEMNASPYAQPGYFAAD